MASADMASEKDCENDELEPNYFEEENTSADELDICLLCCSKIKIDRKIQLKNDDEKPDILFQNLTVIFLLKKVLQVPDSHLQENLRKFGNPDNWLILCDKCNQLSKTAKELHSKLLKTAWQLRITEQLILNKVKCSLVSSPLKKSPQLPVSNNQIDQQPRIKIWMKTRKFITNYNYRDQVTLINPFIEGDKSAQKLLENRQSSATPTKFEEEPDDLDDYDAIWDGAEEEPSNELDDNLDHEWTPEPETASIPITNQLTRLSRKIAETNESSDAKSCDLDTIKEGPEAPVKKQKLDQETKLEPEVSNIPINNRNRSVRLSRRRKTKKLTTPAKSQVTPAKARQKRNQIPHVKIYGKFKCNSCDKLFSSGGACYNHEREKHADIQGQFCCDLCPRVYNTAVILDHHKRQTHKCRLDGTPYIWQAKKKRTEKVTPTICNICGKSVKYLEQHQKIVHDKKVKVFCHVCGKGFKMGGNFKQHLLSLHGDDPVAVKMRGEGVNLWRCGVEGCNGRFMKKESLDRHVEKVHGNYLGGGGVGGAGEGKEGLKSFVCQVCGKGFWRRDKLKRHEMIHSKN